jgi:cytochrome c biogenesis protein CcdA
VSDAPLLLALTAGTLAAVNPCGFALLPAYLSLVVVGDGPRASVGRADGPGALGDPVVAAGERVQRWLATALDGAGVTAVAAALLLAAASAPQVSASWRRPR